MLLWQEMLLQTIFTAGIRIGFVRLGITSWIIHILAGCVFGIGLSVICSIIAEKSKVLNILFFPTKAYKMMRNR